MDDVGKPRDYVKVTTNIFKDRKSVQDIKHSN